MAEDDPDDQDLFLDALHVIDESIICFKADDGEEALSILQELVIAPDIIFLDVNMPKMNGRSCITELKKSSVLRDIPVVIYSTTLDQGDVDNFKRLGATEVLVKASTFQDFVSGLRVTLQTCLLAENGSEPPLRSRRSGIS